jgi:predicted MFS family arabinose efflux permease
MRSTLKSARLRRIIAAYTVNRLGTWFGLLALLVAVFDHTHSALAVAALMFAGQALPALVVPAVVARVEASRRRSELSYLYFFEALATAALAVLLWHFWLPAVLLLMALDGTAALAASALLRAEVARAARDQVEDELAGGRPAIAHGERRAHTDGQMHEAVHEAERRANAVLNVAFSATFVLGPAIGGAVVAIAGGPAALFIDVGSFLICGAMLIDLHPHVEDAGGDSVSARLRVAWQHINEAPSLRAILMVDALALFFIESGGPIEVSYVKATLGAGDAGLGLLLTMWGVGAVLGSLVFARLLRRSLGTLLSIGTVSIGAAYLGLAVAPSLALACVAGLVGGVGNGMQWPSLISLVQRLTPKHLHGRLMGAVESLGSLCLSIGLPLGGALVALSAPRTAFVVVGIGAVLSAAWLLQLSRRPATARALHSGEEQHDVAADDSFGIVGDPVPPEGTAHEAIPR